MSTVVITVASAIGTARRGRPAVENTSITGERREVQEGDVGICREQRRVDFEFVCGSRDTVWSVARLSWEHTRRGIVEAPIVAQKVLVPRCAVQMASKWSVLAVLPKKR